MVTDFRLERDIWALIDYEFGGEPDFCFRFPRI
jgi:hypothetical protein